MGRSHSHAAHPRKAKCRTSWDGNSVRDSLPNHHAFSRVDFKLIMEFLEFLILSAINLVLILFIIRKWSLVSAEGLCMAYLGAAISTDNVELIFHYVVSPGVL